MKKTLFFKQKKPLTVMILGIVLLIFAFLALSEGSNKLEPIVGMFCIGMLLLGYSISFEINDAYSHKKHFRIFGITIFKSQLDFFKPEYVTVFSSTGVKNSEWGPIAAMGKQIHDHSYVVRLFKGGQYFSLYRTKSYELAKSNADKVGKLLKIETHFRD